MKKTKVLLIDDEEELVVTLVERLEIRSFDVKGITDGQEAVECLTNEEFDVVVADLKMPGVDGERIRKIVNERHPGTRVLLMTGHGVQEDDPVCDDCLFKPFSLETLIGRIEEVTTGVGDRDSG